MAQNNRSRTVQKARPKRLRFRLSIIFICCLLSFGVCFAAYVGSVDESNSANTASANSHTDEQDSLQSVTNNDISQSDTVTTDVTDLQYSDDSSYSETISSDVQTDVATDVNVSVTNPVPQSDAKDSSYFDTCAFVGDSISTGFSGYGFIADSRVFAATGLRTDKISEDTIKTTYGEMLAIDALKQCMPENVYIMLGSNGMGWISNEKMVESYGVFIDEVKNTLPSAKIYIISVPPVAASKELIETVSDGKVLNSDIDSYNSMLLNLANEKGVYYVDINTSLKGNDGKLPADVTKDGMHFDKATYEKVINYLLTHTVD